MGVRGGILGELGDGNHNQKIYGKNLLSIKKELKSLKVTHGFNPYAWLFRKDEYTETEGKP